MDLIQLMIVMIFVTQNNFLNGPGISDRLLGFYPNLKENEAKNARAESTQGR